MSLSVFSYKETCLDNLIVPFLPDPFFLLLVRTSVSSVIELFLDHMYSFCVDGTHLKVNLFYFSLLKVCLDSGFKKNPKHFHLLFFLQHLLISPKN